ncbi:D-alanyl-D-alanine carboxypeptidase [Kineosporia sp. J2-2]|uniref:D-alanyl-D-alanine carboxypeptidase n=1 Tax=Kineosporia corallincola TaxID=2835133 RepID=A0ABS5TED3_9ACTN|nr:serine hydrolase [Kineosporia corallincola]MBT0767964.1 D-alanyl-D-alanine carboxypeptidase [Kineosporia corallincola]
MSSSYRSRHALRLIAATAVASGLTLGTVVAPGAALAAPSPSSTDSKSSTDGKKKFVLPEAESWVGGEDLIGTKTLTDLPAGVEQPPAPKSASWLIADLDTREILAAKNVHVPLAPASTLKIFTSLALAPELDTDQVYTGTTEDENIDGTRVGIVAGSRYTVDDLLHGLLMSSGNDCANALGNLVGGQSQATEMMRQKALEIGAFDTVVENTSGLDAKGQVSSAYDLALAGSQALENKQLAKIMTTQSYSFPDQGTSMGAKRKHYQTQNHNRLLGYLPGITGIKNGYTTSALGSNVASATYQGHSYIAVVMRTDGTVFTPVGDMLEWAFKNGQKANPVGTLVKPGELTAMTGPDVPASDGVVAGVAPTATSSPESTEAERLAGDDDSGDGDDLKAALTGTRSSDTRSVTRFWPLAAIAAVLFLLMVFGLRPLLASTRRSRSRGSRRRH